MSARVQHRPWSRELNVSLGTTGSTSAVGGSTSIVVPQIQRRPRDIKEEAPPKKRLSLKQLDAQSSAMRALLLNELELVRANAAQRADVILGQLGGVNLDLVAAHKANELVGLVSHDGSFHRRMNVG